MFKAALGALSSSLVGAVKDSISEYKPTPQNMGGAFTRIAQQGIANLSFRSPILADMASTMLHNFQSELVNRDTVKEYVASDKSAELRKEVESHVGKDASKEKIDKEMFSILDKMRNLVDREGAKAAESSDTFKKYGKFFEKFKSDLNQKKQDQQSEQGGIGSGLSQVAETKLAHIEDNTLKTVKILGDMSLGETQGLTGGHQTSTGNTPAKSSNPYVDPYTGLPSINSAIGGIGGNFLAKIFDEDTISKYANKAKKMLFGDDDNFDTASSKDKPRSANQIDGLITPEFRPKDFVKTAPATPKQPDISSILGDLSLDLTAPSSSKTIENSRETDAREDKKHSESKGLQEKMVDELKALHLTTKENAKESGGIFGTITSLVSSLLPVMGMIGPVLASIGGMLGAVAIPAAAIAGAVGLTALMNSASDHSKTPVADDYGVETFDSIGTDVAPATGSMGDIDRIVPQMPVSSGNSAINTVSTLEDKKAKSASKPNQQSGGNPVAINTTTNNNSSTNVIVGSSVRNHESTYERVQMSNFSGPNQ
jgi:hypothetical protein